MRREKSASPQSLEVPQGFELLRFHWRLRYAAMVRLLERDL